MCRRLLWPVIIVVPILVVSLLFMHIVFPLPSLHAQESATTHSLQAYIAELKSAAQELQGKPTAETMQSIQARLAAIQQVASADGDTINVAPLLGATVEELPTVAEAELRITLILAQLGSGEEKDPDGELALLSTIFEQEQFAQQESLWQRIWRWLRSWLPDLASNETGTPNNWVTMGIYGIGYIILGLGTVLLVYLLSLWFQNLLGGFLGGNSQGRHLTPDGELLNAAEAKAQAQQLARDGSFREAVRRLYLSALLTLDERRLLHYDRSNTNQEVLATVRNNPALYQQLRPVVETFDDVWYGIHEPDQSTFDHYKVAVEQLDEGRE